MEGIVVGGMMSVRAVEEGSGLGALVKGIKMGVGSVAIAGGIRVDDGEGPVPHPVNKRRARKTMATVKDRTGFSPPCSVFQHPRKPGIIRLLLHTRGASGRTSRR